MALSSILKVAGSAALQQMVTETKSRLNNKVDKVTGYGLSQNDFTNALKDKLEGVAEGAQVNVIESIRVDSSILPVSSKIVDLGKMALKDEIGADDLSSTLASTINGKADAATSLAGYGITDAYTKTETDNLLDAKAPLASPALTGEPTAPTATAGTNTTQIATTAFVKNACDAVSQSLAAAFKFKGVVADLTELEAIQNPANGDVYQVTNPGTGKTNAEYAYNGTAWVELGTEIDLSGYAPLASPAFTGTPTAPTASAGTNTTQIATTAYVQTELGDYIETDDIAEITASEVTSMWAD